MEPTALDIAARANRELKAPAVTALAGGMSLLPAEATLPVYTSARLRKEQTHKRLTWLNGLLDDPAQFDAVVASGRYLKLCAMLEWASDNDMMAGARLNGVVANATAAIRSGAE